MFRDFVAGDLFVLCFAVLDKKTYQLPSLPRLLDIHT